MVEAGGVSGPSCGVAREDALPAGRSDRVVVPEGGAAAASGSASSELNVSAPRRSGVECEEGRPLSSPELAVLLAVLSWEPDDHVEGTRSPTAFKRTAGGSVDSDVAETCDEVEDVPDVSEGLEKLWFGGIEGGGEWTATVTT